MSVILSQNAGTELPSANMQVSVSWGASKGNQEFVWSKSMQEVWGFGPQEMGQNLTDKVQA